MCPPCVAWPLSQSASCVTRQSSASRVARTSSTLWLAKAALPSPHSPSSPILPSLGSSALSCSERAEIGVPGWPLSPAQVMVAQRQGADALARDRKDRIAHRQKNRRNTRFANATPFVTTAQRQVRLDLGHGIEAKHLVGIEIALSDAALLDADLAIEEGCEPIGDAALQLFLYSAGIHRMPAVHGTDHTLHPYLALLAHRDFGDLAHDRTIAFEDGHALNRTLGQLLPPVGLLDHGVEHEEPVRTALEEYAPELHRIFPRRMRQLIHKAFDGKGILRAPNRAPEAHRHLRVLNQVLDTVLAKGIGRVGQTFDRTSVD